MLELLAELVQVAIVLALYAAIGGILWTLARWGGGDAGIAQPSFRELFGWPIVLLLDVFARRHGSHDRR